MKADVAFFPILEYFEGFKSCPYMDSAGIATIGIGTTYYPGGKAVKMADTCITHDQAIEYVRNVLSPYEDVVTAHAPNINQNQFDALLSFTYNEGIGAFKSSTLLTKVRANPNDPAIRDEFMKWTKVRNPKTHKLETSSWQVKRRTKEADLYFS